MNNSNTKRRRLHIFCNMMRFRKRTRRMKMNIEAKEQVVTLLIDLVHQAQLTEITVTQEDHKMEMASLILQWTCPLQLIMSLHHYKEISYLTTKIKFNRKRPREIDQWLSSSIISRNMKLNSLLPRIAWQPFNQMLKILQK